MADMEKYRQRYLGDVSAHVGEPVHAVGIFSRPGAMGSMFLGKLSPLAGMVKNQSAKGSSGGLPQNVVIGVSAEKVYVFGYKPKGTGLKLKDPIAVLPRAQTRAEVVGQSTLATRVRFTMPDGDTIELDSNRMPGGGADFNAPIVEALTPA